MGPRTYRLTVEGTLGDVARSAFPGMAVAHRRGTTTIEGHVRDQAELHGLLRRIRDLGLTLLDLAIVERGTTTEPATASQPSVDEARTVSSHG